MKRRWLTPGSLRVMVVLALIGAWELIARVFVTGIASSGEPIFPSIEYLTERGFLQLSNFWTGGLGAPSPSSGGPQTYWGAVLAVLSGSVSSLELVIGGVFVGLVVGISLGLLVSASAIARAIIAGPAHVLRMVPFLALAPLIEVWFGKSQFGALVFIAYGSSVVAFVGMVSAVALTPPILVARARTVGARRWATYRAVVLPSCVPAMRATLLLVLGLGWTLDVAAEFLGAQNGLGVMIEYSLRFAYTSQVIVVAFIYLLYAALSFYLVQWATGRAVTWQPRRAGQLQVQTSGYGGAP